MTCGIYKIRNKSNGKVYIGSSSNIERRLINHRSDLNCNRHHSYHLQAAWSRYGAESFEMGVELICDKHNLKFYEQSIMCFYQSYDRLHGYNISAIAHRLNENITEECRGFAREQARKRAKKYLWNGMEMCLSEIAETEGVQPSLLFRRVIEDRWDLEKAVNTPLQENGILIETRHGNLSFSDLSQVSGINEATLRTRYKSGKRGEDLIATVKRNLTLLEFDGQTRSISEWSKVVGLPSFTISQRLGKLGWSVERALTEGANI